MEGSVILKNKKLFRLLLLSLLIFSIKAFSNVANKCDQNETVRYLDNAIFTGYSYALGGKVGSVFSQSISYNDQSYLYQVEVDSKIYNYSLSMDEELRLEHSEWVTKEQGVIKLLGHDQRITDYNSQTQELTIQYYLDGKLRKTKTVACNRNILDSDMIYLYLQRILAEGITEFNCVVLLKARGLKLNVSFQRKTVKDLMTFSPEYDFPEKFRTYANRLAEGDNQVFVYVMQLTGIYKLFYPHKYYTTFTESPPHRLVAFWGGALDEGDFTFIESIQEY